MPQPTSFYPDEHGSPSGDDVWEIVRTSKTKRTFEAQKGTRRIEISQTPFRMVPAPIRSIEIVGSNQERQAFLVSLQTSAKLLQFTIVATSLGTFRIWPELVGIQSKGVRFEVEIFGVGKGVSRNAWKDSDAARGVVGFIDLPDHLDPIDEESIVWLTGTLGTLGMPLFGNSVS